MIRRLPARIAAVMMSTIVVFVLTLGVCILWLTQALDRQDLEHSAAQLGRAHANLLDRTRSIAVDYAKWDEVAAAAEQGDVGWIYDNFAYEANFGELLQLAMIWGGPFPEDLGWTDDGVEEGRPGLLDPGLLDLLEARLAEAPVASTEGPVFFAWNGGALYVLGAMRIEALDEDAAPAGPADDTPRLLVGHRISDGVIAEMADDYVVDGLELVREEPADRPSLALMGGDGRPVAFLAWTDLRPSIPLLRRMLPPLMMVTTLVAALATLGAVLIRRSAHGLVEAERLASAAARTDAMTGLPNRMAFGEALEKPSRAGERAILFLDVNDFKRINDSIGHEAGDRAIVAVSRRLASLVDADCVLARIAGDEFVFIVTGLDADARTRALADRIRDALARPVAVLGHHLRVELAMGYAVQDADDTTGEDLVRQADLAMYEAKRSKGQARPVAFSAVISQATRQAALIEQGLRRALTQDGQLSVAYQPIVRAGGRLERAEALARWTSPELGPVPPDRFIAVAERAGLIVELGHRLLRIVLDDLSRHPDLKVGVNISTLQLMAPDFVPGLVAELAARGVEPSRIEIEITEAVAVDDSRLAAQRLEELHAAGFSIALDDFGTGYSSVGYLRKLRFDTLKIDRSFVSGVRRSASGVAIVDGIITMAHGLGLRVVCEGVESADDLDLLRELGCDLAQGYHLDRPMPIAALAERWLERPGLAVVA